MSIVMPDKTEHLNQARHNHDFWTSYDPSTTPYVDWVVTGLFYESVHLIEAYLSVYGEHSGGHPDRLRSIRRHRNEIGSIRQDYELLKTESENARYQCFKHQPTDITNDLIPVLDSIKSTIEVFV